MTRISRRSALQGLATGAATLAMPSLAFAAKPRVVVVGGGPGGASAAKYLALWSNKGIDVTLVEPQRQFTTCFFSNLYLGGFRTFESITHSYDAVARRYGYAMARDTATAIDREKKTVTLGGGQTLAYDRLIVAPGIDLKFDSVPGWSEAAAEQMPHAWKAGPQTQLLRKRLDALKDGDTIVMIAPPNPYRCPPGPYERVSMMAHLLKSTGRGKCKIVILDPKPSFSKQAVFAEGWEKHFPGMIEWQDPKVHGGIKSVDPKTNEVKTDLSDYKAALVNVIPAQHAGRIARDAKLTNETGYCPIDPSNMKSRLDANVFVLGDATIAGDMPKSGFSANSQAKVAAMAIRSEIAGGKLQPALYFNTCWSLITTDDGIKVGARYEAKDGKITQVETYISQLKEDARVRKAVAAEGVAWYSAIIADMFS